MKPADRKIIAELAVERPQHSGRECVYCGVRCYGKACPLHRGLIQVDPNMGGVPA